METKPGFKFAVCILITLSLWWLHNIGTCWLILAILTPFIMVFSYVTTFAISSIINLITK